MRNSYLALLSEADPELLGLIEKEMDRQETTLDLIPSENICPPEIMAVLGSALVNKYTEGYPGKRYYPGCEHYDAIERLAIERARNALGLSSDEWHVNVQALSGSPANMAIYMGLMDLGDTLLGMRLAAGGHLTHGHKVSISGKAFNAVQYGVDSATEQIDYDEVERLAKEHKPKVIVSGTTAYPRAIDFGRFREIADAVGAYHVADVSHVGGLIAADAYPSPFPHADAVMMTTHKTLRGPRGAAIFVDKRSHIAEQKGIDIAQAIDKAVFPGLQGGPHNNQTAAIALLFLLAQKDEYKTYQRQIVANAAALANELQDMDYDLFAGGTDCHMMLIKMANKNLDGTEAERRLENVGIIANRNAIPGDPSPFKPSGVRMGTPAITARGMKEEEMRTIAKLINAALTQLEEPDILQKEVLQLCGKYPAYRKRRE